MVLKQKFFNTLITRDGKYTVKLFQLERVRRYGQPFIIEFLT